MKLKNILLPLMALAIGSNVFGANGDIGGLNIRTSSTGTAPFTIPAPGANTVLKFSGGTSIPTAGFIGNASIDPNAGIMLSKLAQNPLDRSLHIGTQPLSSISNAGTLAGLNSVNGSLIDNGSITGADIAGATISLDKLIFPNDPNVWLNGNGTFSVPPGSGSGATNISIVAGPSSVSVNSDTGTDGSILAADSVNAGLLLPSEKAKLANLSGVNTGDQTSVTGNAGTVTTINGKIIAGSNVTISGNGTNADPYAINSSGSGGGGSGDVTGPAGGVVDNQLTAFNGTTGKIVKGSTVTGIAKLTSGVPSAAVAGTDYVIPSGTVANATNADTVTTNANLTGDITSVGNATAIAPGVIVNADISPSAAIAVTKLDSAVATDAEVASAYVPKTTTVNGQALSGNINITIPTPVYLGQITSLGQNIPAPGTANRYYTTQVVGTLTDPDAAGVSVTIGGRLIDNGSQWLAESGQAVPVSIYVDSDLGNDGADGLSDLTAKKTLASAIPLVGSGGRLRVRRGSRFFEDVKNMANNTTIEAYGSGNRPIFDGSRPIPAGNWTPHGSVANVWVANVTLPQATVYNPPGNQWGIMLWDERTNTTNVTARLNYYTSGADIAANIAYVGANPGTFTAHLVGSTNKDARAAVGTQYTFYVNTADSTNPGSNNRPIYYVDMTQHFVMSPGCYVYDMVFQRAGNKDMIGIQYGAGLPGPGGFSRVDILEPSCHAFVAGGMEFRDCLAVGGRWSISYNGAGFHNYRDTLNYGTSKGCQFFNCRAEKFTTGFYTHGSGGSAAEHYSFDVRNCVAVDCTVAVSSGSVTTTITVDRMKAVNCGSFLSTDSGSSPAFISNSSFISNLTGNAGWLTTIGAGPITATNCTAVLRSASGGVNRPFVNSHASNKSTLTLNKCSIYGGIPGATSQNQNFDVSLVDCIYYSTSGTNENVIPWSGTVTATNSYLRIGTTTIDALRTANPGIDSSCFGPWIVQPYSKTIVEADLNNTVGTRTATYGGSGDVLTLSNVDTITPVRGIRVVDAYGSGLHYDGRIVAILTTGGSGTIQVDPAPTGAFSSKTVKYKSFNKQIWPITDDICPIAQNGLSFSTTNVWRYTIGQSIRISNIRSNRTPFGIRKITAISGNIVTIDRACRWYVGDNGSVGYAPITGGTGVVLPTVSVAFDQYINRAGTTGTVTKVEGGTANLSESSSTANFNGSGTLDNFNTYGADGASVVRGQVRNDEGFVNAGIPLTPGDTLTLQADCYIPGLDVSWITEPRMTGRLEPVNGSDITRLRIGAETALLP